MSKVKPTYANVIGFYIEPAERPVWTGEILDLKTGELVKEESMTKQSFKDECDINNIVRKFEITGHIDHINKAAAQGLYIDLPDGVDLQEALSIAAQAEAAFMALPANVRAEFGNDPVNFVDAFRDPSPEQQERFISLGLATDMRQTVAPAPQTPGEAPTAAPAAPVAK